VGSEGCVGQIQQHVRDDATGVDRVNVHACLKQVIRQLAKRVEDVIAHVLVHAQSGEDGEARTDPDERLVSMNADVGGGDLLQSAHGGVDAVDYVTCFCFGTPEW
jgi:hypothetical protein